MLFKDLYNRQVEFEKNFFPVYDITFEDAIKWVKEFCLSAHDELSEVMAELPWKEFHKYDKKYSIERAREEAIDVLKYSFNICIALGMTAEDVEKKFHDKSDVVESRLNLMK